MRRRAGGHPAPARSHPTEVRDALEQGGLALLAPTLLILGVFGILPFLYVLYLSFHQWNPFGANPNQVFIGAEQLPPPGLRHGVPLLALGHAEVRLLRGRLRDRSSATCSPSSSCRSSPARRSSAPSIPCR